ncbi:MAG: hypothetical protein N3D82_01725 [Ignisphaera sp.]|nr:hypothetical protein [Ignisphaera sp.]
MVVISLYMLTKVVAHGVYRAQIDVIDSVMFYFTRPLSTLNSNEKKGNDGFTGSRFTACILPKSAKDLGLGGNHLATLSSTTFIKIPSAAYSSELSSSTLTENNLAIE